VADDTPGTTGQLLAQKPSCVHVNLTIFARPLVTQILGSDWHGTQSCMGAMIDAA
jgi:hypothetical protein